MEDINISFSRGCRSRNPVFARDFGARVTAAGFGDYVKEAGFFEQEYSCPGIGR
jgi:hypothetical protein